MRQSCLLFALLSTVAASAGCDGNQPRRPSPQIADSFGFTGAQNGQITLARKALGRAFMVMPTLIEGTNAPVARLLAPHIVSFELQGNTLAMLERNLHAVYSEMPSERLLQTFEVTHVDAERITFSWQMGLQAIPAAEAFVTSDVPASLEAARHPVQAMLQPQATFLRDVQVVDNGLELEQVSRLDQEQPRSLSVTLRVRIVPYVQNPHFEIRPSTRQRGVGYFEVAHTLPTTGDLDVLATRWDSRPELGPVTFLLSRQIPASLLQTVSEGVLYWNRVAGRELVQVEANADPDQRLGSRQVMVHWINWRTGMAAMAALQPDPTSGELLHAHITLPASMAELGGQLAHPEAPEVAIVPQGFSSAEVCGIYRGSASSLLNSHLHHDRGLGERASADFLRVVVAHEVGHTLGLRHNFAGSTQSALSDPRSEQRAMQDYMRHSNHGGVLTSSTVMDYVDLDDAVLLGAAIRHQALPYDVAALRWGYQDKPVPLAELKAPPFCTDAQSWQAVLGCAANDSGPQPLVSYAARLAQHHQMSDALLGLLAAAMHDQDTATRSAVGTTGLRLADDIRAWDAPRLASAAFQYMAQGASVLEVDQRLQGLRLVDPEAYRRHTAAALGQAAEQAGGLPGLLAAAYPMDASGAPQTGWLARSMLARLHDTEAAHTPAWARLGLTAAERRELEAALPTLGNHFEQELLKIMLDLLTGADEDDLSFAEGVVRASWEPALAEIARHIILDTTGPTKAGSPPRPKFRPHVRLAAVRLFSERLFGQQGWMQRERIALITDLQQRRETLALRPALGQPRTSDPAETQLWLRDEMLLITALQLVE